MADQATLHIAIETAWTVFRATRPGIEASDSRRCLLEHYLRERGGARGCDDAEELACMGLAYLVTIADHEC